MTQGCARTQRRPGSGFSLVELMIVIAVAALIIGLAAPSFSEYIVTQRVRSVQAQLVTDLQYARSEAAARGRFVGVQFQYRAGSGENAGSCYIIFARELHPATTNPYVCQCFDPEGSRCLLAQTVELRRVLIPNELKVTVRVPPSIEAAETGTWRPVAYFDPTNGAYLPGNSSPSELSTDFKITTQADAARALRSVVVPVGRLTLCTPSGSNLGGPPC